MCFMARVVWQVDVVSVSSKDKPLELLRLAGVQFGEVWLCSGQSNMQFSVAQVFNASDEILRAAKYPNMRVFAVALNTSLTPMDDLTAPMLPWSIASPQVRLTRHPTIHSLSAHRTSV
jgi:hypothetical protein